MKRTKINRISWRSFVAVAAIALSGLLPRISSAADTLSLEQCIVLARQNSPELQIASAGVKTARIDRELASRERWPQLKFVGDAGYAPMEHNFGYDPAVSNGGELGARVVADQPIYAGGTFGLKVKQQENEVNRRSIDWQMQDRDLVYNVRQAVINVLLAQTGLKIRRDRVGRLAAYRDLVLRLNKAGTVKSVDLLNAEAELGRARIDVGSAEQSLTSAQLDLNRLLGLQGDVQVELKGSLDSLLISPVDQSAGATSVSSTDNLDLYGARLDSTQSRLDLELARSAWKPSISVTADAGYVSSRENLLLSPPDRYRSVGYSVGINIEMPLWDRGRRKAEVNKSRINLSAATENIALVQRDINYEFHSTQSDFQHARDRLISVRKVLATAESSYLLNKAQYADGFASASDVLLAEQNLTETRQTEIETLAAIQLLKARLDMLTQPVQDNLP